jgi:hypothetical protein
MTVYSTKLRQVKNWGSALVIQFDNENEANRPLGLTGYGLGESWVSKKALDLLTRAICDAARVRNPHDLAGVEVDAVINPLGEVVTLVFPHTHLFVAFGDYVKP